MPGTEILLIRHGHTLSNGGSSDEPRLTGCADVPLSARGRAEVTTLARALRAIEPGFPFIYTSPLARARATAEALREAGLGPLSVCEGLKEIDCGDFDGRTLREVERAIPEVWRANLRQTDEDFRWPGGESYREFRARSLATLRAIARRHAGMRIAVVTHAGVITQVLGELYGVESSRWESYRARNASVTELRWEEHAVRVVRFDDCAHLEAG